MTTLKAGHALEYGDLFDLHETALLTEVDGDTRVHSLYSYARVQSESYYEDDMLILDTSFGFFRIDPNLGFVVHGNTQHPFASRSKT